MGDRISPSRAFSFLTKKFAHIERFGSMKTMRDFLASRKYAENSSAVAPIHRMAVATALAKAMAKVDEKAPLPLYSKRGWRSWDADRIAKLKAADDKHGNDDGIAREMGISLKAAKAARYRYIGPRSRGAMGASTSYMSAAA